MAADEIERAASAIRRASAGRHLLLLLDFDGTLAEFDTDPEAVFLTDERRRRMRALRRIVAGHNVFAWASGILEGLEHISRHTLSLPAFPLKHEGLARFRHPGFGRLATDAVG